MNGALQPSEEVADRETFRSAGGGVHPLFVALCVALFLPMPISAQAPAVPVGEIPCGDPESVGTATIFGLVREAGSEIALPGSTVSLVWTRTPAVGDTLHGELDTVSDGRGTYWFCEAPADARLTLWATALGATGGTSQLRLDDRERIRHDLKISLTPTARGSLEGVLLDRDTEAPITTATLSLAASEGSALTTGEGRFRMEKLRSGIHDLEIQHVAYGTQTVQVEVLPDRTLQLEVRLAPEPIELDPLVVLVEARPEWLERAGFYDRRARGLGQFVGPEEIRARAAQEFTQILENVPGLRLRRYCTPYCYYVPTTSTTPSCPPQFYVDGKKVWLPTVADLNALTSAHDVAAVEVYRGISQTPAQYFGKCGSVVIWTKRVGR